MAITIYPCPLASNGEAREGQREKGQFWTPDWVAEAMVAYVIADGHEILFDPAVGAGAFFRAAKAISSETNRRLVLLGTEAYEDALEQARESGLSESDLAGVQITDFVLRPPKQVLKAIVANPPYIRHHRLPTEVKTQLRSLSVDLLGRAIDGRAGLHVYFLLRALQLLDVGGRLAFIVPADTFEGVFSASLWDWIGKNYCLEAVVTFAPAASPFPQVDTNPVIIMITRDKPKEHFFWVRCNEARTDALKVWTLSGFKEQPDSALSICERRLSEGLRTGLSRAPVDFQLFGVTLGHFATVMRGIATGANDFFFLPAERAASLGLPPEFLVSAIGRTRDVAGEEVTPDTINALKARGRPTLLFAPGGRPIDGFPPSVREYIRHGEAIGLAVKPLIVTRHPWYKMEVRRVPPILFAYLGRRNARFIRNVAGVVPLTGFLCVYPRKHDSAFIEKLWRVLQCPETVANLSLVGKSYGGGAIKVEPRALERLPLPLSVVSEVGLRSYAEPEQMEIPCQP